MIVAGGVSLASDETPGGDSTNWSEGILALSDPQGRWQRVGSLPHPLANGVSLATEEGLVLLGGADQNRHYAEVLMLRWGGGNLETVYLPPMPGTAAYFCGARLGDRIYVAGGRQQPDSPTALRTFWSLDLSKKGLEQKWQELEPWPGPARMLAIAGVQDGSFYLMGGMDFESAQAPTGQVRHLRDAYRYTPDRNWERVADLPRPAVGAPNPAVTLGQSHLLVLGNGSDILAYHTITDTWADLGGPQQQPEEDVDDRRDVPPLLPTMTVATWWRDALVVPGGEVEPGVSTSRVLRAEPVHTTLGFGTIGYGILFAYLASLVLTGFYFSRRERGTSDFFLAGRRIPWWAAGMSLLGTQMSAVTFMTVPAKAYATNWTYLVATMTLIPAAPLIVFYFLPFFCRLNITTAYEYLEKRFDLAVRLIGSISFICFQVGRIGIVLYLPALSISLVTGINVYVGIAVMGVLTAVYCLLGGIEAVIWTDVLQVIVMMGSGLIAFFMIAMSVEGGFGEILSLGVANDKLRLADWDWDIGTASLWVIVIGGFFGQFPQLTSDQSNVQRYLTTRDEKAAAWSVWTNVVLTLLVSVLFFGLGTTLWAFYKTHPELLNPSAQTDAIFPWFVVQQLPEGIAALAIAGLVASAMSSLDSSLNSIATVITHDIYLRFKPTASDLQCLRLARLLILLFAALGSGSALYLVVLDSGSMWDQYFKIVGLFGGGVAGLFVTGIFTRRASASGAIMGFFLSGLVLYFVQSSGSVSFFLFSAIGIVTCAGTGWLASLLLPGAKKSLQGLTIYTIKNPG